MSIICLKLVSGEELIGTLVNEEENCIVIKEVSAVVMMPNPENNGQFRMGLMPFLPYAETENFVLSKHAVVCNFKPSTEMVNNYNRKHGAGIQVVQNING
jgi:hypothetical protein